MCHALVVSQHPTALYPLTRIRLRLTDLGFTSRGVGGGGALSPNGRDRVDPFLDGSEFQTHGFVLRTGVFCIFTDEVS